MISSTETQLFSMNSEKMSRSLPVISNSKAVPVTVYTMQSESFSKKDFLFVSAKEFTIFPQRQCSAYHCWIHGRLFSESTSAAILKSLAITAELRLGITSD